ncbi:hypothetical protein [Lysinibacillus xylanilyticus]|uniref:hypothetical protein n=1 Tax=Lysinibacillus xylanilyticus TaxID=582475 RepID=UPI003CFF5FD8
MYEVKALQTNTPEYAKDLTELEPFVPFYIIGIKIDKRRLFDGKYNNWQCRVSSDEQN